MRENLENGEGQRRDLREGVPERPEALALIQRISMVRAEG